MKETTVEELKTKRENSESFVLLDVRDAHEYYISDIDGTTRIPYDDLKSRYEELNPDDEIVTICRTGNSASDAAEFLESKGFENVSVLKGGINEWAKKIDTSLPQY
ncbi:rhodanese-like domain-containing protein [Rhodohalobacter sp.]|uniref:rhodanese-like domain-containing protein n=1 Tax=Rhodohalobacter sp. TaxID=1974210 RepID=UPI002ACEEEF8|nr:rhodanese-like domain-containing protein [Rhodohalobacter sp.]MDZ7755732.1 rhodanese-like domain-containing protein [Rhodohalobacter sp.]